MGVVPQPIGRALRSPLLRAAATSCVIMSAGDVICQAIQRGRVRGGTDWERVKRFAVAGGTLHGPYFLGAFKFIDHVCGPQTTLKGAFVKTAFGQVTVFPVYIGVFFFYMSLLEGRSTEAAYQRTKSVFVPTFLTGSVFWPLVNMVTFSAVPIEQRVLSVNIAGLVWNSYMSWQNSKAKQA